MRHLTGERQDIPELVVGRDTPLELEHEYTVTLPARTPEAAETAVTLDRQQATDLYNLIHVLAGERPERPIDGCPSIERDMEPDDQLLQTAVPRP